MSFPLFALPGDGRGGHSGSRYLRHRFHRAFPVRVRVLQWLLLIAGIGLTRRAGQARGAVPESDSLRKHALDCMRLAADCMQLVGDVHSPALQQHFLRMARVWTTRAERHSGTDTDQEFN